MKTKSMIICAVFSAILCVFCVITVPIGPVPVSLATFAIMLNAVILTPKLSVISVALYILLGAVGLPVYSSFRGGLQTLVGPTGGYIWSYVLMTLIISCTAKKYPQNKLAIFISCIAGIILCYLFGTVQFATVQNVPFSSAVAVCVLPFVPLDIVKAVAATALGTSIKKSLHKAKMTSL